jgi:hypothetical protein
MENNSKPSFIKSTLIYGCILGALLIIFDVILYISNFMPVGFFKPLLLLLVTLLIYIIGTIIFAKKVRNEYYPNEFSFGKAFLTCLLISVSAIILSQSFAYLRASVIDPDFYPRVFEAQKEFMLDFFTKNNVPEDKIDEAIVKMDEEFAKYTPFISTLKAAGISLIFSAIFSLIVAAIIKKRANPFQDELN